jgi:hypothetical protein
MCMIMPAVDDISRTRLFARIDGDRQFLVYSMAYAAHHAAAMLLPLPIRRGSREDDIEFVDNSKYSSGRRNLAVLHGVTSVRRTETVCTMRTRNSLGITVLSGEGSTTRLKFCLKHTSGRQGRSLGMNFPMAFLSMKRSQI